MAVVLPLVLPRPIEHFSTSASFVLTSIFNFHIISFTSWFPIDPTFSFNDTPFPGLTYWQHYICLPSFIGIALSAFFFVSITILLNSLNRVILRSRKSHKKAISINSARTVAIIAFIISIVFRVLSITASVYSFEEIYPIAWGMPPYRYNLNGLGWSLLVIENIFGGLTIVIVGILLKRMATKSHNRHITADKLFLASGLIYMIAVVVTFVTYLILIFVNLTFLGAIIAIIGGLTGTAGFSAKRISTGSQADSEDT